MKIIWRALCLTAEHAYVRTDGTLNLGLVISDVLFLAVTVFGAMALAGVAWAQIPAAVFGFLAGGSTRPLRKSIGFPLQIDIDKAAAEDARRLSMPDDQSG